MAIGLGLVCGYRERTRVSLYVFGGCPHHHHHRRRRISLFGISLYQATVFEQGIVPVRGVHAPHIEHYRIETVRHGFVTK